MVDSDQQVTAILDLKLKQAGFEIKILSGTVNALKIVKEFSPDLIISEMVLPELSGVDFLKRVKMNPETSSIPFIFLSSSRNIEDKILAHEMGAEAFFMKPIFIKVLIQRIKDFFEQAGFNELLSLSSENKEYKGHLTNISLIDILNIVSENKSTGTVFFQNAVNEKAKIYFINGSAVRIEVEGGANKNGEEELYKLLSWLDGTFTMTYGDVNVQRNVRIPHDRLIVKAVNWLDDYTGEMSEMPPLDTRLYLDFSRFMNEINKFPDKISCIIKNIGTEGSRLSDIIDRTDLDRKQTVSYLKKMMEQDVVTVVKKETPFVLPQKPGWLISENNEMPEKSFDRFSSFEEEVSKKHNRDFEKTIVPPPDLIEKDTIDPAVGISLQFATDPEQEEKAEVPVPSLINAENLDFGAIDDDAQPGDDDAQPGPVPEEQEIESLEKDEFSFSKADVVKNDDELKTILEDHFSDLHENEVKPRSMVYSADRDGAGVFKVLLILLFIVLFAGGPILLYILSPEKFDEYRLIIGSYISGETASEQIETPQAPLEQKEIEKDEKKEEILSDRQKEFLEEPVETLVDKAAAFYEKDKMEEAVEINKVALYKLKESGVSTGSIYEKVITNMAIYLYMLDKGEEALVFARESAELREDSKAIELQVAILDFLGRRSEAASLLRSKLEEPQYEEKKNEWIREINRLEKLE
jgi:CheY-like chemotaxis protein